MSSNQPPGTPGPEDIQRAINEVAKPNDFPLEVKLETGQVYRGQTPQDVLNALVKAQEEASRTIKAREQEMWQLREKVGELEAKIPAPPQDPDKAQNEQFFGQLAEKPRRAILEALATEVGIAPDRLAPMLKDSIETNIAQRGSSGFIERNPDYPNTAEAAVMMSAALKTSPLLDDTDRRPTANNLEIVYGQLKREGRIQPAYVAPSQIVNPTQAMPVLRGSAVPSNQAMEAISQAQSMDLTKLKQVIDNLEARMRGAS